jgi:membrane fusion protein, copper/silver efflux system
MNTRKIVIMVALALLLGVGTGYWWSRQTHEPTASAATQMDGRRVLYWHDPMMPDQKFDKPGKSPFMDMQLVPVYADDTSSEPGIKVNSSVSQTLGIRVGKVERQVIQRQLTAVGSIAFDEHRVQLVQARVGGYVTTLFVKAQLDHVNKDQPLAEIASPEWQAAEEEYAVLLRSDSSQSRELRASARERLKLLDIPESAIKDIERTRAAKSVTTIYAPIEGVVTELGIREGAAFMSGATLFRINGLQSVWVNAQVPEAQIAAAPIGAAVAARATAWPGETFAGRIETLVPQVDAVTRTFTVRASLDNPRRKLVPGMFVSLDINQAKGESHLIVPSEAVITTGQRAVVILANDENSFSVANVVTGAQVGDKTIIVKGLEEGNKIVLSGQFLIDSEASLKSTVDRLGAASPEERR